MHQPCPSFCPSSISSQEEQPRAGPLAIYIIEQRALQPRQPRFVDERMGSEKEGNSLRVVQRAALSSPTRCPAETSQHSAAVLHSLCEGSLPVCCVPGSPLGAGGPGGKRTPGCREPRPEPKKPRGRPLRPRLWGLLALGSRAVGLDRAGSSSAVQSQ